MLAGSADYGPGNQDALFSPFTDRMARLDILVGAGVVAAGPQNRIPVTVMNNSEHPVKLFAGTRIGALSPIKVEEEHPDVNTVTANPPPPPTVPKQGPAAVNLDSCEVTASEKQELKQLLDEYRDVFANNDSEVGRTHRTQFRIHTSTQVPVAVKLRRTPFSLRSEVDQQIKNMEQRGIIEPSNSPYSAPILLVPKADGSYRFCADFRALNDATITEIFLCLLFVNAWILFMAPIFSLPLTCTVVIGRFRLLRDIAARPRSRLNLAIGSFVLCPSVLKMPQLSLHASWQIL